MNTQSRPRIAWFSTLEDPRQSASVASYCSHQLLPLLKEHFEIDVFTKGMTAALSPTSPLQGLPIYHYLSAFERDIKRKYDIFFYQVDDSLSTRFLRVHMGQMPGMVWFHDLVFTSFGPEPILNSPWHASVSGFLSGKTEWPIRGEEIPQFGPFGFRESAFAAQALFSNPTGLAEFRRNASVTLSSVMKPASMCLPMPVDPTLERTQAVPGRIGFCGSPRIEHRAHKLLLALRHLSGPYHLHWLLDAEEKPAAEELLSEFGISQVTIVCGRSPERWAACAKDCQVAVHTLFSVYSQPDPYLAISLVLGVPSVATRFGAVEYLPDSLVAKVEAGETEATELTQAVQALLSPQGQALSSRIRDFGLQRHSRIHVANDLGFYWQNSLEAQREFRTRWRVYEMNAVESLLEEAKHLMPPPEGGIDAWSQIGISCAKEFGWTA